MMKTKQFPHNIDAEENVIGSLLLGGELMIWGQNFLARKYCSEPIKEA